MNSKYKVLKFSSQNFKETEDLISVEEPLEISLKYKIPNGGNLSKLFIPIPM